MSLSQPFLFHGQSHNYSRALLLRLPWSVCEGHVMKSHANKEVFTFVSSQAVIQTTLPQQQKSKAGPHWPQWPDCDVIVVPMLSPTVRAA